MSAERHYGFEIENKITKFNHPDAMISPTLENVPYDRERDVYLLDSFVLTSGQSPLSCKTVYTFWGTFELISPPFTHTDRMPDLLDEGKHAIFQDIPQRYIPWREFIVTENGPPMRFDFIPVEIDTCTLELYKYDISIELTTFEARIIESKGLIETFNTDFVVPSLSMVRILNNTPVLHTAFDGMITQEELPTLTHSHIKRVLYELER